MRRTNLAPPRLGQQPSGKGDKVLPSTQPRSRWRRRGDRLQTGRRQGCNPYLGRASRQDQWVGIQPRYTGQGLHNRAGQADREPEELLGLGHSGRAE